MDKRASNWRDRRKAKAVNGIGTTAALQPLLMESEAAELLGIAPQTLRNARSSGIGAYASLRWLKIGRGVIRYQPHVLQQ